jgi:hypothetical protein
LTHQPINRTTNGIAWCVSGWARYPGKAVHGPTHRGGLRRVRSGNRRKHRRFSVCRSLPPGAADFFSNLLSRTDAHRDLRQRLIQTASRRQCSATPDKQPCAGTRGLGFPDSSISRGLLIEPTHARANLPGASKERLPAGSQSRLLSKELRCQRKASRSSSCWW